MPKVSIIIPVYNGENYMRQAINSALAQTYSNVEIIVVNDGSTDGGKTEKVALSYGDRIRYFYKENGGVATALNFGIEKMEGEYFSWLSHDDLYEPNKIERQMEAILGCKDNAIAVCNTTVISESGKVLMVNNINNRFERSVSCFLSFDIETGLNGCALLIPRVLFDKYGLFNPELKCTQDYDMWFRFSKNEKFILVRENLVLSRSHDAQDSKTKTDLCTSEADILHSRFISELSIWDIKNYCDEDIEYYKNIYKVYFNSGYKKTAIRILDAILRIYSLNSCLNEAVSFFNSEIIGSLSQEYAHQIWDKVVSKHINSVSTKPHLLFYSNIWVRGGIERVLSIVMNELKDKYEITLVSNTCDEKECFPLPESVNHILVNSNLEVRIPFSLVSLCEVLNVDIFIGNPNIISSFLDVYPLLKDFGIKSIAANHGYYFLPYTYTWLHPIITKQKEIYKFVSVVTWLTTFNTSIYGCINKNGVLLPNPCTFEIDSCEVAPKKDNIVLCVGRFYDNIKRLDRVLKIFRKVLDNNPEAKLCLVGGYNLDSRIPSQNDITISELLYKLDFPINSILWEGERSNIEEYYKKASLLIMVSDSEGFSMVLTEAGAFGLPCIIFKTNGLEDIITDGENGFIIEQDDIDGIAEKTTLLLNDECLRTKMGYRARELAQRFDKKEICLKWERILDMILRTNDQECINMEISKNFAVTMKDPNKFASDVINEYEKNISMVLAPQYNSVDTNVKSSVNMGKVCTDCIVVMQNTLSWRITKPLRWSKALYRSLKGNGIRVTIGKIIRRLKKINNVE